jgi:hypothetical protein
VILPPESVAFGSPVSAGALDDVTGVVLLPVLVLVDATGVLPAALLDGLPPLLLLLLQAVSAISSAPPTTNPRLAEERTDLAVLNMRLLLDVGS